MTERFEDRCIISGIGQSDVGRRVTKGVMALTLDAVLEAIADAGLKPADIDGVMSWPGAVTRNDSLRPERPGRLRTRPARGDRRAAAAAHLVLRRTGDAGHVRRRDPRLHGGGHRDVPARRRLPRRSTRRRPGGR